jgi:hypothetical protein
MEEELKMIKLGYALAALAAVAFVTPSIAQDKPKADITVKQDNVPGGEVKRVEGKREEGRAPAGGEMRRDGERRWHRAHAEPVVIIHRRDRHHHHHHHHEM